MSSSFFASVRSEKEQTLLSCKNPSAEEIAAKFIASTGYYDMESLEQGRAYVHLIQNYDNLDCKTVPCVTGRLNLYSGKSLDAHVISALHAANQLDSEDAQRDENVERSVLVAALRALQASVRRYSNFTFICIFLLVLSYVSREYVFFQPFWKGKFEWGTCTKLTVARLSCCTVATVVYVVGLCRCYFWTPAYQIAQWFMGIFLLASVVVSTYSSDPSDYIPSISYLGVNFTIFCIIVYFYLRLTYQSLKMLVLIAQQPIERLKKNNQVQQ